MLIVGWDVRNDEILTLVIPTISGVKIEELQYEICVFFRPGHYDLCYPKNYDINNLKIKI